MCPHRPSWILIIQLLGFLLHILVIVTPSMLTSSTNEPVLSTVPNPYGVLIIPDGMMAPLASTWHIAIALNYTPLEIALADLQHSLKREKDLSPRVQPHPSSPGLGRILNITFTQAEASFNALEARLSPTYKSRVTRGITGTGTVASAIFGVASEDDIERLQLELNSLRNREQTLVHLQHAQLTAFSSLSNHLSETIHRVNTNIHATNLMFRTVLHLYLQHNSSLPPQTTIHTMWQERLLNTLHIYIDSVHQFQNAIDRVQAGYLPTTLISPTQLQPLLTNISNTITPKYHLPVSSPALAAYYDAPLTTLLFTSPYPSALINIPLLQPHIRLYRYSVIPTPTISSHLSYPYILSTPIHTFFTNQDHSSFITYPAPTKPPVCSFHDPIICDVSSRPREPASRHCLTTLFVTANQTIQNQILHNFSSCALHPSADPSPVITSLSPRQWIISTYSNLSVHLTCPNTANVQLMSGTMVLYLPPACSATFANLTLPPLPNLGSTIKPMSLPINFSVIPEPNITQSLSSDALPHLLTSLAANIYKLRELPNPNFTDILTHLHTLTSELDKPDPITNTFPEYIPYCVDTLLLIAIAAIAFICIRRQCLARTIVTPPQVIPLMELRRPETSSP